MKEYENFLNLEVVWKDEHMLELEVIVTNNSYSGVARGYDTREQLEILANQLEGFPKDDQPVFYKIGESMQQGHLSISFCPISLSGLVGVKVYLEKGGWTDCQNSIVSTELLVEPSAIDIFQKYLTTLATNQQGIAKLIAR
jgi:hypothetical protein